MSAFEILALDAQSEAPRRFPLPLDGECVVTLTSVSGSSAVAVPLVRDGDVTATLEVESEGGDTVALRLVPNGDGLPYVDARHRRVLVLAGDHTPVRPFRPRADVAELDVCLLVDGTTLVAGGELLLDSPEWPEHAARLVAFIDALRARYHSIRASVIAFGDVAADTFRARDLMPAYALFPKDRDQRRLAALSGARLAAALEEVPATSGGDYVDALAGALRACRDVGWRPDARHIVVLTGDSPGFSLLRPAPRDADAHVRRFDVDDEALALHALEVEVVTIFHRSTTSDVYLDHAREQYARLATRPELAFRALEFDPAAAAGSVLADAPLIARGPSLGLFTTATPSR